MAINSQLQDGALIDLVLAGRADCFTLLMDRHLAIVKKRIRTLVRNSPEAEDLVQEVLLKVWLRLSTFRSESSFRTWVTQIATNEALQLFRRERCRRITPVRHDFDTMTSLSESPFQLLARREKIQLTRNTIAKLPAKYRQVLVLRDFEELSEKEAAHSIDVSVPAVKTRLRRARQMLQAKIQQTNVGATRTLVNNYCTRRERESLRQARAV